MSTKHRRTALVTGSNRGIGLAIAKGLAARGDIMLLAAARLADDAVACASDIGRGTVGVALDLSSPDEARVRVREIEAEHGPVDILVNNAGVLIDHYGADVSIEDLERSLAVNAVAPFALVQELGAGMKERGWGRVVNVSSGWGSFEEGLTGPPAYSISKATLNAVTLTLAQWLGPAVKVNAAGPGWVRTRMGGASATRTPEEGADTPIWLATLPDDGPTGLMFRDRTLVPW